MIENPHPAVSIFNFHYASPPDAVGMNYGLNKVIGDNETGFKGTNDGHYRMEAWEFILAGGGLYNNLDYSFAAGFEDGTFVYPAKQPGGGNSAFRRQMRWLKEFIEGFDFVKMRPDPAVVRGLPEKTAVRALVEPGRQYAVYWRGDGVCKLELELPAGRYDRVWLDPLTGRRTKESFRQKETGRAVFSFVEHEGELALGLVRR